MLPKSVTSPSRPNVRVGLRIRGGGVLDEFCALRELVETQNACVLPGCTIKYDSFMTILRRAVSRGYVRDHHAAFVEDGLTNGFTLGVSRFRWYRSEKSIREKGNPDYTFAHLFADFGTKGAPATFKIFLVDVVVQMARSEMVLTLPLVVYVDDVAAIDADKERLDTEMRIFQDW